MKLTSYLLFFFLVTPSLAFAHSSGGTQITMFLESYLTPFVSLLESVFFFKIAGFPFLVAWLVVGGVFFTFKLGFINIRLFRHGIDVAFGKYTSPDEPGKVSHAQALFAAVSATVGLGNIAGVAIAITLGGPGAVIWMMIAAFFGMSTKFAEVYLGQKYRRIKDGRLYAGPFYYLRDGLHDIGYARVGKILALFAAFTCVLGAIGAGVMFQVNQATAVFVQNFGLNDSGRLFVVLIFTGIVGFIIIGGIERIARFAEKIVPFMAILYILSSLIILAANYTDIPAAIMVMLRSAFTDNALYGGVLGAIIQGFRRAAFSNEAGIGSAPIAHAAAKSNDPVKEGCVALLEPFIDTIVICFMTGLVITVTGVYQGADLSSGGVLITAKAFATVSDWFPFILSVVVFLFAFSTMLTYCYYGRQAWLFLTKGKGQIVCNMVFIFAIIIGGMVNLGVLIDLADIFYLSMAIPNLIGLYFLSGKIKGATDVYVGKLKSGQLPTYK